MTSTTKSPNITKEGSKERLLQKIELTAKRLAEKFTYLHDSYKNLKSESSDSISDSIMHELEFQTRNIWKKELDEKIAKSAVQKLILAGYNIEVEAEIDMAKFTERYKKTIEEAEAHIKTTRIMEKEISGILGECLEAKSTSEVNERISNLIPNIIPGYIELKSYGLVLENMEKAGQKLGSAKSEEERKEAILTLRDMREATLLDQLKSTEPSQEQENQASDIKEAETTQEETAPARINRTETIEDKVTNQWILVAKKHYKDFSEWAKLSEEERASFDELFKSVDETKSMEAAMETWKRINTIWLGKTETINNLDKSMLIERINMAEDEEEMIKLSRITLTLHVTHYRNELFQLFDEEGELCINYFLEEEKRELERSNTTDDKKLTELMKASVQAKHDTRFKLSASTAMLFDYINLMNEKHKSGSYLDEAPMWDYLYELCYDAYLRYKLPKRAGEIDTMPPIQAPSGTPPAGGYIN